MAPGDKHQHSKTAHTAESGLNEADGQHHHDVDADDVPILTDDVLFDDDHPIAQASSAPAAPRHEDPSFNAAIRQLESMELSSARTTTTRPVTAQQPALNPNAANRPASRPEQRTSTQQAVIPPSKPPARPVTASMQRPAVFDSKPSASSIRMAMIQDNPLDTPVEFTENQFLKSSTSKVNANLMDPAKKPQQTQRPATSTDEDGSEQILKLLGEKKIDIRTANHYLEADANTNTRRPSSPPPQQRVRDPFYDMDRPEPPRQSVAAAPGGLDMDALVEEIIDEYKPILEAALRKKLKEKMLEMIRK